MDKNKENDKILYKLWKKLWGEDISDFDYDSASEDFYEKIEQQKKHKHRKESLKAKRILICFSLIIIIYLLGCLSFWGYKNLVKNNEFFACLGKDVCIYKGTKIKNPSFFQMVQKTDDGKIFIFNLIDYNIYYHKYKNFISKFFLIQSSDFLIDLQKAKNFLGYKKFSVEYYAPKHKSFKKIKIDKLNNFNNLTNFNDKVLFIHYNDKFHQESPYIFSFDISGKIEPFCTNIFSKKYNNMGTDLYFLKKYNEKNLLIISNYNKIPLDLLYNGYTSEYKLKYKENLYLFNMESKEMIKLPDFDIPAIYHPIAEDIRILNNGKIIIPIRSCQYKYFGDYCHANWDHTEIYIPQENRFVSETNTDVLKDNLFDIDLDDGNILFINKDSSFIFNNQTNKFEELNEPDKSLYKSFVRDIEEKFTEKTGCALDEPIEKRCRILKLTKNKFLIFSGDYYAYRKTLDRRKYTKAKSKTIYVDFEKGTITEGPSFIMPHYHSNIVKINDNSFMLIGGTSDSLEPNHYSLQNVANERIQIIKFK